MSAPLSHILHKNCVHHCIHQFKSFRQLIPLLAIPKNWAYSQLLYKEFNSDAAYLQIIGSGAKGAPKSVYLCSDSYRYLFNCGEGTQRLLEEHKIKTRGLEHIFITYPCWGNFGGLPALAFALRHHGVTGLTLHGPDALEHFGRFANVSLPIEMAKRSVSSIYDGPAVTIQYVPLLCQQSDESSQKSSTNSETSKFTHTAMCFVCKLKPNSGIFNNLFELKPTDVEFPDYSEPVFIVVDCPSVHHLDSLLNEEKFKAYQSGAVGENLLKYIIHFTPSHIMNDERYKSWMKLFSDKTEQVNVNDFNTRMFSYGPHYLARQLNYLDSEIFPLLADQSFNLSSNRVSDSADGSKQIFPEEKLNIPAHVGHSLKVLHLRGTKKIEPQYKNPQSIIEDLHRIEGFETMYDKLKSDLATISSQVKSENDENPYPIITFLGTGAFPSMTRNNSGILITLSDDNHIILDCGEGTYGQMVRLFGPDEVDRILALTEAIYVSHLHPDHYLGAITLMQKRREAVEKFNTKCKKVYLLAPGNFISKLRVYNGYFESIFDCFELIDNENLLDEKVHYRYAVNRMFEVLNVKEIKTCEVLHCPDSFGVSITDSNGNKITYSGDTRPSDKLVNLGMNSDLLIHEATYGDALSIKASLSDHSTTSQAIEIGRRMNAKFTILTHFSSRDEKIVPVITEYFDDKVGIAFDNMRVRFGDFKKLPLFNSILKTMFSGRPKYLKSTKIVDFSNVKGKKKILVK